MKPIFVLMLLTLTCGIGRAQNKPQCKNGALDPYHDIGHYQQFEDFRPAKCVSGRWVVDEDAWKKRQQENAVEEAKFKAKVAHKVYLWNALRTRVVTDAEMKEILELGVEIIPAEDGGGPIDWCGGAQACGVPPDYATQDRDKARDAEIIFNNALLNQFKMRVMKESVKP